jgi:ABC-type transport system involved in multi-copper enzyme maturation permease subunit
MNLLIILENTVRESLAKKTILGLLVISLLFLIVVAVIALTVNLNSIFGDPRFMRFSDPAILQRNVQAGLLSLMVFPAMILSIFATASIMTSTIEKGYIDLLLSKPVSRLELLTGRFLGGLTIVLLNFILFGVGLWVITSLKFGDWDTGILMGLTSCWLAFAVMLPFIMLMGMLFRSSALAMIVTYVFVFIIDPLIAAKDSIYALLHNDAVLAVMNFIYAVIPKPNEISGLSGTLVMHGHVDWMVLWSSALSAVAAFVLMAWLFRRRDF